MNKRKKFSIAEDIDRGITEVINAVNSNIGAFRYEVIALTRIEVDPNNPRELALSEKEINFDIDVNDPQLTKKQQEKEELESLAHTIRQNGMINPIMVYRHGDKYRIIAGERRFLAAHMAKKNDIHARVVERKPDEVELRLLQWVENNERKDLSLHERLKNLETIIEAYKKKQANNTMTSDILKNLTGLSKTQAHYYLTVLRGPEDLKKSISTNIINNLDKAVLIAGIADPSLRQTIIAASANGSSIQALKDMVAKNKAEERRNLQKLSPEKRGRTAQYVNLGRTKNITAIKEMVDIIVEHPTYNKHIEVFNAINWNEYKDVSLAFQTLLSILSNKHK